MVRCRAFSFGGSPRKVIFDNLKAAVLSGCGRSAVLHPEFAALCGHYRMEPVPCEARDPESKGRVEAGVRYVKRNALAGRDDELTSFQAYNDLAISWRDDVANRRTHDRLKERPIDRFEQEKQALRSLPKPRFDTDEVVLTSVRSTAQVIFETNRYSVPPQLPGKTVLIRANKEWLNIHNHAEQVAEHVRCYSQRESGNIQTAENGSVRIAGNNFDLAIAGKSFAMQFGAQRRGDAEKCHRSESHLCDSVALRAAESNFAALVRYLLAARKQRMLLIHKRDR